MFDHSPQAALCDHAMEHTLTSTHTSNTTASRTHTSTSPTPEALMAAVVQALPPSLCNAGRAHPPCSQAPTGPRPSTRPALEALWGLRTHHRGDRHHSSPWKTSTWNSSSEYLGSDLHATPTLLKRDCMTVSGEGVQSGWGGCLGRRLGWLFLPAGSPQGSRQRVERHTPAECTMHLGAPVVPDENITKSGWLKGSCSNSSCGACSPFLVARNSSRNTLGAKHTETDSEHSRILGCICGASQARHGRALPPTAAL